MEPEQQLERPRTQPESKPAVAKRPMAPRARPVWQLAAEYGHSGGYTNLQSCAKGACSTSASDKSHDELALVDRIRVCWHGNVSPWMRIQIEVGSSICVAEKLDRRPLLFLGFHRSHRLLRERVDGKPR